MKKLQTWKNQTFCFRLSIVAVLIWLIISSIITIIIYFSGHHDTPYKISIFEFFTWLFAFPATALFGLINAIPFILDWLLEPIENSLGNYIEDKKEEKKEEKKNEVHLTTTHRNNHQHQHHPKHHKGTATKNRANPNQPRKAASYNTVATKLEQKAMEQTNSTDDDDE